MGQTDPKTNVYSLSKTHLVCRNFGGTHNTQNEKYSPKFQDQIYSLTSISSCLNIENGSNWPPRQNVYSLSKTHLCVETLGHTQHPKWKIFTKFQDKINNITSISSFLNIEEWVKLTPRQNVYSLSKTHLCVETLGAHTTPKMKNIHQISRQNK